MLRHLAKSVIPAPLRVKLRRMRDRWRPLFYVGWSAECPCCGARCREFLPHGRPERDHALCARCGAVERHRLCMLYLKNRTNLFSERLRLLHFAPETVFRKIFSALPNLEYVTTDFSPSANVRMDITNLAFPDGSFDAILCMHVLEHIPDDRGAMRELLRVLRPGGWAILQVPLDLSRERTYEDWSITDAQERFRHFGQEDHVRWYGRDYKERLEGAGFQVTVEDYVRSFPPELIHRYGFIRDESIYLCRKPG